MEVSGTSHQQYFKTYARGKILLATDPTHFSFSNSSFSVPFCSFSVWSSNDILELEIVVMVSNLYSAWIAW